MYMVKKAESKQGLWGGDSFWPPDTKQFIQCLLQTFYMPGTEDIAGNKTQNPCFVLDTFQARAMHFYT